MKQQKLEQLQKDIEEANERIEVLGDACHLYEDPLMIELCGITYSINNFITSNEELEEDVEESEIYAHCYEYAGIGNFYKIKVSQEFLKEYLNKLRRKCIETHTWTFEEAEPEEYKAAKAAEEAMKNPDFKEIFEYSEDPERDPFLDPILDFHNRLRKFASDTQVLWWQQHG